MPVFDRDPLTGRWVIHAPARSGRPRSRPEHDETDRGCPFCPGNEDATPPESLRIEDTAGRWLVRVFPNLYPAVGDEASESGTDGPRPGSPVSGDHEVVVFTPDHEASFADLDDHGAAVALQAFALRVHHHREAGRTYVQPFINQGAGAGATVEHPHGQVLALDVVPPLVVQEERVLAQEPCPLCDLLERTEMQVAVRDQLVVACPPWASGRFEMLVGPAAHADLAELAPQEAGPVLRDALLALRGAAGAVDHNVVLHASDQHWHAHISPRITVAAGFELGSGMRINPSSPVDDRETLRDAWTG